METDSLVSSVQLVGEPWAESPYYDDAEKWTFMFWGESTPFRKLFERLDLDSTLELACGYGRHAAIIADRVGSLVLMDIFDQNLARCRERLQGHKNIQYLKGDGFTFQPVAAQSLSAIYCYDAMVHFSPDIVASYLLDAARVLRPQGQILLHHSNYDTQGNDQHYGLNPHARNHMTYELFQEGAARAGLEIVDSILIDWGKTNQAPQLDRATLLRR
jgi:ubiquinone/menaquinone biosynthesis C-methylase UbiE